MHHWRLPRLPALWLVLLLAAASLGAGLGLRDPSPPDEPRFVLAARHMVESGQWLIPHRGSELYAHKPPPFMWLQAAAYTVVRDWRIAFLLPSLLAALGTLWLVYDLAARLWNRRVAACAGFALLACLQFGLQAKRGQIDMVLVFWTTLSLWGLSRHLLRGPDWGALALGGFAAGIGTVTKGVGFLPLLVVLPWWLARQRDPALQRWHGGGLRWLWLAAGFLAGVAVWLLPMLVAVLDTGDAALHRYASEILFKQTATRYAHAWHHVKPSWYYLQVIATLWLPGALLLPWLVPAWWRRIRRGDARIAVLVGWAALVLVFFTLSPGKREVYIFPALPALCIAAAPLLAGLLRRTAVRRLLLGYVLAMAALALALGISGLSGARWAARLAADRGLDATGLHGLLAWLCVLGTGALLLAAWGRMAWAQETCDPEAWRWRAWRVRATGPARGRQARGLQVQVAAVVVGFNLLLWTVYGLGLAPALDASSSARAMMQQVRERIGADAELGLVGWREQHLLQAIGPTREFGFERDSRAQWRDAVAWLSVAPDRRWLFALDETVGDCVDRRRLIDLGRSSRREWLLVPGAAWTAGCVPALPALPAGPAGLESRDPD